MQTPCYSCMHCPRCCCSSMASSALQCSTAPRKIFRCACVHGWPRPCVSSCGVTSHGSPGGCERMGTKLKSRCHCIVALRVLLCRRPKQRNAASAHLLPSVLRSGSGSVIAITLLLREVAKRAGVDIDVATMDGGSYCVAWPRSVGGRHLRCSMNVHGHRCGSSLVRYHSALQGDQLPRELYRSASPTQRCDFL